MASSFVSFGMALAMAMQVASDQRNKPKAEHADVPAVLATKPGVKDSEQGRRPVPRLSQRSVLDEASTIEGSGQRRQAKPRVPAGERKTLIIRLHHVPAVDTAETIKKWLEAEAKASGQAAATVVAVVITNDLLVSGSSEQLDIIRDVVHELDRPLPQIRVQAMLADLTLPAAPESLVRQPVAIVSKGDINDIVAELTERGDLRVVATPEVLAANNQSAFLQFGSRVPRVTGSSVSSRGRTKQTTLENVGMILGVTGRVTEQDLVTLEIDLERSHLEPENEGTAVAASGDDPSVSQVKTVTLQTTVSLRSGQTVLVGGMVYRTEQRCGELLLLLKPQIVQPNDGP